MLTTEEHPVLEPTTKTKESFQVGSRKLLPKSNSEDWWFMNIHTLEVSSTVYELEIQMVQKYGLGPTTHELDRESGMKV